MAGRANWEDRIKGIFKNNNNNNSTKPEAKAVEASKHLGTGMADNAATAIRSYKERQKKAMQDAGVY